MIKLEVDFYYEISEFPVTLMKYRKAGVNHSIADIAEADIIVGDDKIRLELITTGAGNYIPAGSKISLRTHKLE